MRKAVVFLTARADQAQTGLTHGTELKKRPATYIRHHMTEHYEPEVKGRSELKVPWWGFALPEAGCQSF